jgi:hypothetical protein
MGLCSDEMDNRLPAVDLNELNSFTHKPVNASLYDFWVLAYKGINNANFAMRGYSQYSVNRHIPRTSGSERRDSCAPFFTSTSPDGSEMCRW